MSVYICILIYTSHIHMGCVYTVFGEKNVCILCVYTVFGEKNVYIRFVYMNQVILKPGAAIYLWSEFVYSYIQAV